MKARPSPGAVTTDVAEMAGAAKSGGKNTRIHLQGSFYPLTRKVNDKAEANVDFTR